MLQTSTTYKLTLPDGDMLAFGEDDTVNDFVGYLTDITSSVNMRESVTDVTQADAIYMGDSYLGARTTVLDISLFDRDPNIRAQKMEKMLKLNMYLRQDIDITWTEATGIEKLIRGRLSQYPTPKHNLGPRKDFQLQFTSQPHIQSNLLHSFQDIEPISLVDLYNLGNAPAWPKFQAHGPFTQLRISAPGTGQKIWVSYPTASGHYIEIDTDPSNRYVYHDGASDQNIYEFVDFDDTDFFSIPPGVQGITYIPTGTTTGDTKLDVWWRSSWY